MRDNWSGMDRETLQLEGLVENDVGRVQELNYKRITQI
jgi:hypothetical protein